MTAHDIPNAAALVEAVREFLEGDVLAATEGRVQFHARVAVNVLRIVERELAERGNGDDDAEERARETALAEAIRDGSLDGAALADVREQVRATVRAKLLVANPGYLDGPRL